MKEFKVCRNVFSQEYCELVKTQMEMEVQLISYKQNKPQSELISFDPSLVVSGQIGLYASTFSESILDTLTSFVSKETNCNLAPTYSYWRKYFKGAWMKIHTDRSSCEYSVTACFGLDGDPWPIHFKNKNGSTTSVEMQPGDLVIYKGIEVPHWREEFKEGKHCYQVFLHYINLDGIYKDFIYDERSMLGLPKNFQQSATKLLY